MGGETSAVTNPYDPAVVGLMLGMKLPDGSEKTISFQGRKPPLGIDFIRKAPLTVKSVKAGSHGEALGCQSGSKLSPRKVTRLESRHVKITFAVSGHQKQK